ncbi:MFS transporter [Streptomyces sp. Je 1-79]|uniref:MDR family MFS transporter n=1 Tax=Streptomyces sp. Je 1-79 TaxID=2943847 RepID=UPI0021A335D9|nr:MFS transporter [Streptomyces sp. Je 1-79]MCT4356925.1 MFS transporter [Streptomyces sp. Je 1-79]
MSIDSLRRSARATVSGLPGGFWWLWLSTLVNRTGAFVLTFLSLYLTQELGHSAWFAGLVVALHGLGGVAGSPLGGTLTDKWGRRPTMVTMHLVTASCAVALALVSTAWGIAAVVLLMGVSMQAVRPSIQATIADMVPEHDRRRAYALNYWALNLGFAVAAFGGGAAIFLGYRTLFLVEAVATALCAVIVFLRLPETRPEARRNPAGEIEEKDRVSVLDVLRDAPFRTLVLLNLLVCLVFTAPWVGLPLSMAAAGLEPGAYGAVIAVNGVVIVAFQLLVNKVTDKRSPAMLLTVSSLLFAVGTGATALAGTPLVFAATVIVWTIGEMVHVPTNAAATAKLAPEHARGRYQGVMGMSWALSGFLAPILAGWVVDGPGPDFLWMATGVVGAVAALGYATRLRKVLDEGESTDRAGGGGTPPADGLHPEPPAVGLHPEPPAVVGEDPEPPLGQGTSTGTGTGTGKPAATAPVSA